MFSVGELLVYGGMGVCTVEDIEPVEMFGQKRQCYVLRPHYVANAKVYAPVENTPMVMRELMDLQAVHDLVDRLPAIEAFICGSDRQELYTLCRSTIRSADAFLLAKLLHTLYLRKQQMHEQKKMMPTAEKEFYDMAERMLFGEIAVVAQVPIEEVRTYIADRLEGDAQIGFVVTLQ